MLAHFPLNRVWGLCLFGSGCWWLWTRFGLHPHWFTWDTGIGHFLRLAWCHYIFSLFWLSPLSTFSDNSKLQLTPNIRTHKLWCQARALLAPVSLATKMSASKLIFYFSSHPKPLDFGPPLHQIISPWILPTGKLISLSLIFRLVLVLLHMLLLTWSNSSLASRWPLWYSFLSAQGWGRCCTCIWSVWITLQDLWHFGQGCFQASWKLSLHFSISGLILFPGSIVRFGLHISLFFTVLGRWFLLVRLACMAVLIGLWHMLTLWVCLSLFLPRGVARPDHRLGSNSQYKETYVRVCARD